MLQNLKSILVVCLALNHIGGTTGQIPKGDTTKVLLVLVFADQGLKFFRRDVARLGGGAASRKTDEDLSILAHVAAIQNIFPFIKVESPAQKRKDVAAFGGVARRVVVELDEESIEGSLLDHLLHVEPGVASWALRGTGDDQRWVQGAESFNHGNVRHVVCGTSTLAWVSSDLVKSQTLTKVPLDIKVESVDCSVFRLAEVKRTRVIPLRIVRAKSPIQELGKVLSILLGCNLVVANSRIIDTTNAE